MAEAFVAFAIDTTPQTRAALPFAESGVDLGLGEQMISTLTGAELADPRQWRVEAQTERGASAVARSALEMLASHRLWKPGRPSVRTSNEITISSGTRGNCVGEPATAPSIAADLRQLSIQPAKDSFESCLGWFAVDLYLNDNQEIAAVVLELWED